MKEKHHKPQNQQNTIDSSVENNEIIETLQKNLVEAAKDAEKYKDEYLRAHAEMENLRKRQAQELEKNTKYAIAKFAKDVLSASDNLNRALEAVALADKEAASEAIKNMITGIEITESELQNILTKNGVSKIPSVGCVFDPNFHQVIQEFEDPSQPAGTIIQELQAGYVINDRLLRAAMVIVTKGGPKASEINGANINTEA